MSCEKKKRETAKLEEDVKTIKKELGKRFKDMAKNRAKSNRKAVSDCKPYKESQIKAMLESQAFKKGNCLRNQTIFSLECATGVSTKDILALKICSVLDQDGHTRKAIPAFNSKTQTEITIEPVKEYHLQFLKLWLQYRQTLEEIEQDPRLFPSPNPNKPAVSSRQIAYVYNNAHIELEIECFHGIYSGLNTWAQDMYDCLHKKRDRRLEPLLELYQTGRWPNFDSMMKSIYSFKEIPRTARCSNF